MLLDTDALAMQTVEHALDRRRARNKAYYICKHCSNQFLYNRAKDRLCPICNKALGFVQTVDMYTEQMIVSYSNGTVIIEGKESY